MTIITTDMCTILLIFTLSKISQLQICIILNKCHYIKPQDYGLLLPMASVPICIVPGLISSCLWTSVVASLTETSHSSEILYSVTNLPSSYCPHLPQKKSQKFQLPPTRCFRVHTHYWPQLLCFPLPPISQIGLFPGHSLFVRILLSRNLPDSPKSFKAMLKHSPTSEAYKQGPDHTTKHFLPLNLPPSPANLGPIQSHEGNDFVLLNTWREVSICCADETFLKQPN